MKINYTIKLLSDAEPGTGLGGEIINQRIPRDLAGDPMIPANHIKGLLREELLRIEDALELDGLTARCLGQPDEKDQDERYQNEALCRLSDASLEKSQKDTSKDSTDYITRTAIDEHSGTAKDSSLRTTERIDKGTVFCGELYLPGNGNSQEELAIQTGLLAISAIGSNRNRGAGRVLVTIEKNEKKPSDLFRAVQGSQSFQRSVKSETSCLTSSAERVALRLIFKASSPVCVPERPVVTGVIQSGFAISPSSVRGWIISRIAQEYGDELATKFYESDQFRAWPLLPCGTNYQPNYPVPTRVSLTHKIAKLIADGDKLNEDQVEDKPICEVNPENIQNNSPLKASDGVLLSFAGKSERNVEIWKAKSMPHTLTAHGVHNDPNTADGRNLYQVESMAPMVWSGIVLMPKNWAQLLQESIKNNPEAAFGRFRSTRGMGTIEITEETNILPWSQTEHDDIIILQSPIALNEKSNGQTANSEFETLIAERWPEITAKWSVQAVSTNIGIQFGWNRSGKGEMTGLGRRQKAQRVVLPGSIFKIIGQNGNNLTESERAELRTILPKLIQNGLGDGIQRGFGAVSVHPGLAQKVFTTNSKKEQLRKSTKKKIINYVLQMWKDIEKDKKECPSASQIAAVAGIAAKSRKDAVQYLENQVTRLEKIWATWEPIKKNVQEIINTDSYTNEDLQVGLKFLADLIKAKKNQQEGKR